MVYKKSAIHKLEALILAFIGVAAMVAAWFILLTTASHDVKIVALEAAGVVITLVGYFLWKYSNKECEVATCEAQVGNHSN
ncbi:Uncharacterised protein [uncultured archaeon]|nr:Uncharacterised protein [uncultured archaeon]